MAWTVLSDATLEVGKALRALTMRNLRDNITALANGDAGAPQIQTAAIAASAVTAAKIAAGNVLNAAIGAGQVTSDKLAAGAGEVNWVLARTAGATTGAVGTYAYMTRTSSSFEGTAYAGSQLNYSGTSSAGAVTAGGGVGAGTWLCMGRMTAAGTTLFLRIA